MVFPVNNPRGKYQETDINVNHGNFTPYHG